MCAQYDTLVVMMQWLDTDDGRLAYDDSGTGDPLVLLHGGFLDHHMWEDQVPAFAARYRVIAPDARGHGASANATRPFRHADDVAVLLRHLGTGRAILAGVSMGAGIAVDTALEHPDQVRALVVSGAGTSEPTFTDPWTQTVLGQWTAAMAAGDLDGSIDAFTLFAAGPGRSLDDVSPGVVARIRDMARRTMSKHGRGERDWSVPVRDTWERAAKIDVPVLAVPGALDSPDHIEMAERLASLVADGRTTVIEGAAHYPNMEHPEDFQQAVTEFLQA
jgi:pimeloyl-ACP methyl ester carboxylesterase